MPEYLFVSITMRYKVYTIVGQYFFYISVLTLIACYFWLYGAEICFFDGGASDSIIHYDCTCLKLRIT